MDFIVEPPVGQPPRRGRRPHIHNARFQDASTKVTHGTVNGSSLSMDIKPSELESAPEARTYGGGFQLVQHISHLWNFLGVPEWHRQLFKAAFFNEDFGLAVLSEEISALLAGSSPVLVAMSAVEKRESVLRNLQALRDQYEDQEFLSIGKPRHQLLQELVQFQLTTLAVVEAIANWRRSVVSVTRSEEAINSSDINMRFSTEMYSVSGPRARGACWPCSPSGKGEDYLLTVADHNAVICTFKEVIDLSADRDPFLITCMEMQNSTSIKADPLKSGLKQDAIGPNHPSSLPKLRLPSVSTAVRARIEAAERILVEEEIGLLLSSGRNIPNCHARFGALLGGYKKSHSPFCERRGMLMHDGDKFSEAVLRRAQQSPTTRTTMESKARFLQGAEQPACLASIAALQLKALRSRQLAAGNLINRNKQRASDSHVSEKDRTSIIDPLPVLAEQSPETKRVVLVHPCAIAPVFERFQVDGRMLEELIPEALKRLGFWFSRSELLEYGKSQVKISGTMDAAQFVVLVRACEIEFQRVTYELFQRWDMDASGDLDMVNSISLLQFLEANTHRSVLKEAIHDVSGNGSITWPDIIKVIQVLQDHVLFGRTECKVFHGVFEAFDHGRTGDINVADLDVIMPYLGYMVPKQELNIIAHHVDVGASGVLLWNDFLFTMSMVRQHEINSIVQVSEKLGFPFNAPIGTESIVNLMYGLGYFPDEQTVRRILHELDNGLKMSLSLDTVLPFTAAYRQCEGLSEVDAARLDKIFRTYANKSGLVTQSAAFRVLRRLGFVLPLKNKMNLCKKVDRYCSGSLDIFQCRKMLRFCIESRMQHALLIFSRFSAQANVLSLTDAEDALLSVCPQLAHHCEDTASLRQIIFKDASPGSDAAVNKVMFLKSVRRAISLTTAAQSGGFSEDEVAAMKKEMNCEDACLEDLVSLSELVDLIVKTFPEMETFDVRTHLRDFLAENDINEVRWTLAFDEILLVVRAVVDVHSKTVMEKQLRAARQAGFSRQEVQEFKQIFASRRGGKDLSPQDILGMLRNIMPVTDIGESDLEVLCLSAQHAFGSKTEGPEAKAGLNVQKQMVKAFMTVKFSDEQKGTLLDFPAFLVLMRNILDVDFCQVNGFARRWAEDRPSMKAANGVALLPKENVVDRISNERESEP